MVTGMVESPLMGSMRITVSRGNRRSSKATTAIVCAGRTPAAGPANAPMIVRPVRVDTETVRNESPSTVTVYVPSRLSPAASNTSAAKWRNRPVESNSVRLSSFRLRMGTVMDRLTTPRARSNRSRPTSAPPW